MLGCAVAVAVAVGGSSRAHADRYEATITLRPTAAVARIDEPSAAAAATVGGGGLHAGLSWGVRNGLDLGGELVAIGLAEARYPGATPDVSGNPTPGELRRTTRLGHLLATATWRLGVGWVPTIQLGLGAGVRQRTAARLRLDGAGVEVAPDDAAAAVALDVVAGVRVGLDHRLTRRWTLGMAAGATGCAGIGAPRLAMVEATLSLGYTWYPLW